MIYIYTYISKELPMLSGSSRFQIHTMWLLQAPTVGKWLPQGEKVVMLHLFIFLKQHFPPHTFCGCWEQPCSKGVDFWPKPSFCRLQSHRFGFGQHENSDCTKPVASTLANLNLEDLMVPSDCSVGGYFELFWTVWNFLGHWHVCMFFFPSYLCTMRW